MIYPTKSIINETFDKIEIIIPNKQTKLTFVILAFFVLFPLVNLINLLFFSALFDSSVSFSAFHTILAILIIIVLFLILLKAIQSFIWNLFGKEIILIANEELSIRKKGLLFSKTKVFDLKNLKNLRISNTQELSNSMNSSNMVYLKFEIDNKTYSFARGIYEIEANFILDKLKTSGKLKEDNFLIV